MKAGHVEILARRPCKDSLFALHSAAFPAILNEHKQTTRVVIQIQFEALMNAAVMSPRSSGGSAPPRCGLMALVFLFRSLMTNSRPSFQLEPSSFSHLASDLSPNRLGPVVCGGVGRRAERGGGKRRKKGCIIVIARVVCQRGRTHQLPRRASASPVVTGVLIASVFRYAVPVSIIKRYQF